MSLSDAHDDVVMTYRFERERTDGSAYASGHVLHSAPGRTGFPVRLATELFQRCATHLAERGVRPPLTLYDPCCGAGQLLTTIGLLHRDAIGDLIGSDIDEEAVELARRNLALCSPAGLSARIAELEERHRAFGRPGHAAAAEDGRRLLDGTMAAGDRPLPVSAFAADITRPGALAGRIAGGHVDLVITDVPYGNWSAWSTDGTDPPEATEATEATDDARTETPIGRMLETLRPALAPGAVVAVVSGKDQRATHPAYRRVERWQIGRRRIEIVEPIPDDDGT